VRVRVCTCRTSYQSSVALSCNMLQSVAVCCSMLQCVAECCWQSSEARIHTRPLQSNHLPTPPPFSPRALFLCSLPLSLVAFFEKLADNLILPTFLQSLRASRLLLPCYVLQRVAACCSVLQHVASCCSVLLLPYRDPFLFLACCLSFLYCLAPARFFAHAPDLWCARARCLHSPSSMPRMRPCHSYVCVSVRVCVREREKEKKERESVNECVCVCARAHMCA